MKDLIKKTMYMGAGLAHLTKEKAEEISRDLVKKGELSAAETREFINELTRKSEEARKSLEEGVEKIVKGVLAKLDIATKKDLEDLKKRIAELEKKEDSVETG